MDYFYSLLNMAYVKKFLNSAQRKVCTNFVVINDVISEVFQTYPPMRETDRDQTFTKMLCCQFTHLETDNQIEIIFKTFIVTTPWTNTSNTSNTAISKSMKKMQ